MFKQIIQYLKNLFRVKNTEPELTIHKCKCLECNKEFVIVLKLTDVRLSCPLCETSFFIERIKLRDRRILTYHYYKLKDS